MQQTTFLFIQDPEGWAVLDVSGSVSVHVAVTNVQMSRLMTKLTKWECAQRRLRSAWASAQSDQSLLCAHWVAKDPSFLHADSEDSDQTGRMPRLIWVFAGRTLTLLVLSWGGSYIRNIVVLKYDCNNYSFIFWYSRTTSLCHTLSNVRHTTLT